MSERQKALAEKKKLRENRQRSRLGDELEYENSSATHSQFSHQESRHGVEEGKDHD